MKRLVIRPLAESDIRDAVSWYDDRGSHLGDGFIDDLRTVLHRIRIMPFQFPVIDRDIRRALFRKFPYSIYFLLRPDDEAVVLAVLHQHRNPSRWKKRRAGA